MTRTELDTAMDWIAKVTDEICPENCSLFGDESDCPYRMTRGDGVVKCAFDAVAEAVKKELDERTNRGLIPGTMWRYFTGTVFQIVLICNDFNYPDTKMVVCKNTDTGYMWVRPVREFLEPLDPVQFPNAEQKFRFERV